MIPEPLRQFPPARVEPGLYRNISGNAATALGLSCCGRAREPQDGARRVPDHACQRHPARAQQAQELRCARPSRREDEIAAVGAAIGRRVRRRAGRHHHQRPRHGCSKAEAIGLARRDRAAARDHRRSARRPVARACQPRPSKPTSCMAVYGRNGESPLCVLAASTPGECFYMAIEAVRLRRLGT